MRMVTLQVFLQGLLLWCISSRVYAFHLHQIAPSLLRNKGFGVRETFLLLEKEGKDIDIENVSKEVEEALAAANRALESSSSTLGKIAPPLTPPPQLTTIKKVPAPPSPPKLDPVALKKKSELDGQIFPAAVGGALIGGALGVGLLLTDALGLDSDTGFTVPALTAVFLAGSAAATAGEDNFVGTISRAVFANPVSEFGNSVVGSIKRTLRNAFQSVVGFPGRVTNAIKQKVKDTTDEIVSFPGKAASKVKEEVIAIPNKVITAAETKIKQVESDIKAIPGNVADAVERTAEAAVKEIAATPGRVADATKETVRRTVDAATQAVEDTVEAAAQAVEETVEEIIAMPGKAVKAVGEKVEDVVEDIAAFPKDISDKLKQSFEEVAPQGSRSQGSPSAKVEPPKREAPKVAIPNFEVPKIEFPKVALPKIEVIKVPDLPKPKSKTEPPQIRSPPLQTSAEAKKKSAQVSQQMKKQAAEKAKLIDEIKQTAARAAEEKRQAAAKAAEEKRQAAAQAKLAAEEKKKAEEKRQAAAKAAEQKKQASIEQTRLAAEGKKKALEEAKAASARAAKEADAKRKAEQEAENARKAAIQAKKEAEDRRKALMEEKAAEAAKRAEAAAKKALEEKERRAALAAKQAEAVAKAKTEAEKAAAAAERKRKAVASTTTAGQSKVEPKSSRPKRPLLTRAPRGVPTIVKWRQRRDGGIAGVIYGSPNFDEGDRIETTVIVSGSIENGSVVQTGSGSRYFLSDTVPVGAPDKSALKTLLDAIPGATITLSKEARQREAKKAADALEQAPPTVKTFSLFNLLGPEAGSEASVDSAKTKAPPVQGTKKGPPGVPTIRKWRKNRDGSVTGFISGSSTFAEGEKVTTSPIMSGEVVSGNVVRTGSGSRYFLD